MWRERKQVVPWKFPSSACAAERWLQGSALQHFSRGIRAGLGDRQRGCDARSLPGAARAALQQWRAACTVSLWRCAPGRLGAGRRGRAAATFPFSEVRRDGRESFLGRGEGGRGGRRASRPSAANIRSVRPPPAYCGSQASEGGPAGELARSILARSFLQADSEQLRPAPPGLGPMARGSRSLCF